MGLARYFVASNGREWIVTLEGASMGRYASRSEAVDAAIVMADLMGSMQHDADVMLQRTPRAPLELVWTYGLDPLPAQRIRGGTTPSTGPSRRHVLRIQHGEAAA